MIVRPFVMIGAKALAPHLIKAHLSVRPSFRRVIIWNRTIEKARKLAEEMRDNGVFDGVSFDSNGCLTAEEHLDLVGSFKHYMGECDKEAIRRGRLFVDDKPHWRKQGSFGGCCLQG
jgi:ornithine cyclodeaminase/alanine dehydrogenase-like protein (mu-crystallin family)